MDKIYSSPPDSDIEQMLAHVIVRNTIERQQQQLIRHWHQYALRRAYRYCASVALLMLITAGTAYACTPPRDRQCEGFRSSQLTYAQAITSSKEIFSRL